MNVVAGVGMMIHAAPLNALFLEVIKIVITNVLLVSIFTSKYFEILIIMFSLYLKLPGMKISDAYQLVAYATQVRTVAAEVVCQQYPVLRFACHQIPHG